MLTQMGKSEMVLVIIMDINYYYYMIGDLENKN